MIREDGLKNRLIKELIQLQELVVARVQQATARPGSRLKPLDESIAAMKKNLDEETLTAFDKLVDKSTLAIVPISISSCSACGMSLPASLVLHVRAADSIYRCPNCTRMLYFPEGHPRGVFKKTKRGTSRIGLVRFSNPELMMPQIEARDPDEVIQVICQNMEDQGFVDEADRLAEEAIKREAMMSTGVDHAIAFPHARGIEGGGLTLAVATSKKGVQFGGPGKKLTRIFFFMTIPTAASVFYLKVLAGLNQSYQDKDNREELMEADTPEAMWDSILKATQKTISL
jgi:mannitol/fructose-specific phosphotransferase system IIA component (Ntr-type)